MFGSVFQFQLMAEADAEAEKIEVLTYNWAPAYEKDHPLNEPHVFDWPDGMNFAVTKKSSLDFECEEAAGKTLEFAMRKSGMTVCGFYPTMENVQEAGVWDTLSHVDYLFVWNKQGKCVHSSY